MKNLLNFCIVLLLFSSCSVTKPNQNLNPILLNANLKYLPRPLQSDSVNSKTFISAGFIKTEGVNEEDARGGGGEFSISRAHIFKDFNIAYGASVTGGKITYKTFDDAGKFPKDEKASFGTLLLQSSIQGVMVDGNIEFRYLSLDFGYSKEFGNYKNIRNQFLGNEYYTVVANTAIFSAGFSTEFALHKNNFSGAFRIGLGRNFGALNYSKGSYTGKQSRIVAEVSIYAKYKAVFVVLDYGSDNARLGFGYSF